LQDERPVLRERRLRAVKLLCRKETVTVVELSITRGELAENAYRKDFIPSMRYDGHLSQSSGQPQRSARGPT
jgi:hypothetical protein